MAFFVEIMPLVCYVTMNLYTGVISWIVLRFSVKKHLRLSELVCCCFNVVVGFALMFQERLWSKKSLRLP